MQVCAHVLGSMTQMCLLQLFFTYFSETGSFTDPGTQQYSRLVSKEPHPAPPALAFTALVLWLVLLLFYVGSGALNLGPHTCETGTLLMETSSTPLLPLPSEEEF